MEHTAQWKHLDMKRFFVSGLLLASTLRFIMHPLNNVKTRMQVYGADRPLSAAVRAVWGRRVAYAIMRVCQR